MPTLEELQAQVERLTAERDLAEEERRLTEEELYRVKVKLESLDWDTQNKTIETLMERLRQEEDRGVQLNREAADLREALRGTQTEQGLRSQLEDAKRQIGDLLCHKLELGKAEKQLAVARERLQMVVRSAADLRRRCGLPYRVKDLKVGQYFADKDGPLFVESVRNPGAYAGLMSVNFRHYTKMGWGHSHGGGTSSTGHWKPDDLIQNWITDLRELTPEERAALPAISPEELQPAPAPKDPEP